MECVPCHGQAQRALLEAKAEEAVAQRALDTVTASIVTARASVSAQENEVELARVAPKDASELRHALPPSPPPAPSTVAAKLECKRIGEALFKCDRAIGRLRHSIATVASATGHRGSTSVSCAERAAVAAAENCDAADAAVKTTRGMIKLLSPGPDLVDARSELVIVMEFVRHVFPNCVP